MADVARAARKGLSSERRHVRREVRTALELAIVALAPPPLVDRLATAAGLLEALDELPSDTGQARELAGTTVAHASQALNDWNDWRASRLPEPV